MEGNLFQSLDYSIEEQKIMGRVASLYGSTGDGDGEDGVDILSDTKKIVIEDKLETAYASLCLDGDLHAYNLAISSVDELLDTFDEKSEKKFIDDVITTIKCLYHVESHLNELDSEELRVAKYLDCQNQYGLGYLTLK